MRDRRNLPVTCGQGIAATTEWSLRDRQTVRLTSARGTVAFAEWSLRDRRTVPFTSVRSIAASTEWRLRDRRTLPFTSARSIAASTLLQSGVCVTGEPCDSRALLETVKDTNPALSPSKSSLRDFLYRSKRFAFHKCSMKKAQGSVQCSAEKSLFVNCMRTIVAENVILNDKVTDLIMVTERREWCAGLKVVHNAHR